MTAVFIYFGYADWLIWYGWMLPSEASIMHNTGIVCTILTILGFASTLAFLMCPALDPSIPFCIPLPNNYSALTLTTVSSFIITTITGITIAR